jgi:hypothetical protein
MTNLSKSTSVLVASTKITEFGLGTQAQQPTSLLSILIPQAYASGNGYSAATEDDVEYYNVYGNYAYFQTPSYLSSIFTDENEYIEQFLNAKWNGANHDTTQAGWLITAVAGFGGSGISADTADLVYVDESVYGNEASYNMEIPGGWVNGQTEESEILCNGGSNNVIETAYGNYVFGHNTNVPCGTTQYSDNYNNSVFFENRNTVSSSQWAGDVTGTVQANTAYENRDSQNNLVTWLSSTNIDMTCTQSTSSSSVITGNIESGGTATWAHLSNVPPAC